MSEQRVDPDASDESDEPRRELEAVHAGDTIVVDGVAAHVVSRGRRVNYGQQGLYKFTLSPDAFGVVASLYVDRDPYKLTLCNGPVREIEPGAVEVRDD